MASWPSRKRGSGFGSSRRRGGRLRQPRYGKSGTFSRKKKSSMSMQKMKKQIDSLALMQHGQPRKYALTGDPGALHARACTGGRYYFAVPVSEILRAACATSPSLWVTGISLEGDFYHASPMDWFAVCVPVSSGDLPRVDLDSSTFRFPLGRLQMDGDTMPDLWDKDEPYVRCVSKAGFSELARDGTLFNAPMRAGVAPRGSMSLNGGKKRTPHSGRASASLSRKGDAGSGLVTDKVVKDTFRVWWDISKKLTICDSQGDLIGDRYTVLCGVRPQVDEDFNIKKVGEPLEVAYLKDIRVTVYVRQ